MKSTIKLAIIAIAAFTLSTSTSAQESKIMAGGGLSYASEINNIGLFAKGIYLINDSWEGAGTFTYFFKKDYTTWTALDFNGHYVFSSNESTSFYALGGLNMTFYKIKIDGVSSDLGGDWGIDYTGDEMGEYNPYADMQSTLGSSFESSGSEIGFNIGIGGRYALTESLYLNGEAKYTLGGADYFSIGAGLMYRF
ncbi:MAG: hypothetical protein JEZ14_08525 [Marinilabiliaceae bacterium]|nr:hypothetical protein [Marinilabiliaceae bacterium]